MYDHTPAHDWQSLTAAAVLGTGRGIAIELPSDGALGRLCAALPPDKPEERLLHAAGVLSIYVAAGARDKSVAATTIDECDPTDIPPASALSGSHLRQILDSGHIALLADWCNAASHARKRAPDEALPSLLTTLNKHFGESWSAAAVTVLGQRGRWLAVHNSEWHLVTADWDQLAASWDESSRAQRGLLLRAMRRIDAARARSFTEQGLESADADERAALVAALEVELSPADEACLEASLDDGSKIVRAEAANLLARLPGSRFCARMADRARHLVQLETQRKLLRGKRLALTVVLPEATRELARDGVENRKQGSLGNKAWMLAQIVGATPLASWSHLTAAAPEEILDCAAADEWYEPLFLGWSMAAARQQEQSWAQALLRVALTPAKKKPITLPGDCLAALVRAAPPERREEILEPAFGPRRAALTENPAWPLLLACDHSWSETFTHAVLSALRRHIESIASTWDPRLRLEHAVYIAVHALPAAAEAALRDWPEPDQSWSPATRKWSDEQIRLARFRRGYLKELLP